MKLEELTPQNVSELLAAIAGQTREAPSVANVMRYLFEHGACTLEAVADGLGYTGKAKTMEDAKQTVRRTIDRINQHTERFFFADDGIGLRWAFWIWEIWCSKGLGGRRGRCLHMVKGKNRPGKEQRDPLARKEGVCLRDAAGSVKHQVSMNVEGRAV